MEVIRLAEIPTPETVDLTPYADRVATIETTYAQKTEIPDISGKADKQAALKAWVGAEDVRAGYRRWVSIGDTMGPVTPFPTLTSVRVVVESNADRKTNSTWTNTEASNWTYLTQDRIGEFLKGEIYLSGYIATYLGKYYRCQAMGVVAEPLKTAGQWAEITDPPLDLLYIPKLADRVTVIETDYAKKTDIPPATDLTPLNTRVTTLETATKPKDAASSLGVSAIAPVTIGSASSLPTLATATVSPNTADPALAQNWKVFPLTNGEEWRNTANTGIFLRVEYTATGFDFTYAGITGSPWSVSDGTSRSFTGTLAAQTKSYVSSATSVTVTIPGNAKTFTILKPSADVTTGWTLQAQHTAIAYPCCIWKSTAGGFIKYLWGKNTVVAQVWGLVGEWKIDQFTTAAQPQQTLTIAGTETKYLTLDNTTKLTITSPSNEVITLNKPRSAVTWDGAIEKPEPWNNAAWDAPTIGYTDATQYYQWRNKIDTGEYLRITFGTTNTIIERVKASVQRDDWYRLTKADGSIVTGKAGASVTSGQFALFELWYASGVNSSVPATAPDFYLPLPTLLNDKNAIPQPWTDLVARKALDATPAGQAIAALTVRVANIETLQSQARSLFTTFNAGTWIAFKSIQLTIPTTGNRSLQVRSNTGSSIALKWFTWLTWDGTNDAIPMKATITTTSTQYLLSGWNFGNTGNSQQAIISDTTNNKRYKVICVIGAGYNNNTLLVEDIS